MIEDSPAANAHRLYWIRNLFDGRSLKRGRSPSLLAVRSDKVGSG